MTQFLLGLAVAVNVLSGPRTLTVQFVSGMSGRNVTVAFDGGNMHTVFAGRLVFRDANRSWGSYCAEPRAPMGGGQIFDAKIYSTLKLGGNIARAGGIVSKFFHEARTPDQCAGLQLAIWEAVEDGGDQADFTSGKFQVSASPAVMAYAQNYYDGADPNGDALFIDRGNIRGAQSQLSSITN